MKNQSHKKIPPTAAQDRRTPLRDLFPAITPYSTGFLSVDDIHTLYWEQSGNPDGIPIVLLHGGPGAGASTKHRRFFDPAHYRIIILDQRGAGRSAPLGSIENNTLPHLLSDLEKLRDHLNIDRWHVFGGSWGSTLALAYAQENPDRCISLIIYGIFLNEQPEIDWFLYGIRSLFPEMWENFASIIPEDEQYDLLDAYYHRLTSGTTEDQIKAALHWAAYEMNCATLLPDPENLVTEEQKNYALAFARIESHYFRNNVIPVDQSLLNHIDKIRAIPATIIQGRYDVICPIQTAYKLHQLWPEADYVVVPDGAHSSFDPAVRSRLIEATEHAKTLK